MALEIVLKPKFPPGTVVRHRLGMKMVVVGYMWEESLNYMCTWWDSSGRRHVEPAIAGSEIESLDEGDAD